MNRNTSPSTRNTAQVLLAALLAGMLASCGVESDQAFVFPDDEAITSFEVTPYAAGKSPDETLYLVEIGLSVASGVVPPPAIQLLTRDARGESHRHIVEDSGRRGDRTAGDRIWSAILPADQLPLDENGAPGKTAGWKFSCDVKIVGPGQECLSWGECPDKTALGGDTWFCFCFDKCTIKYE